MNRPLKPSEISPDVPAFDRFAGAASVLASRAPFFAACVVLVVVWLGQGVVLVARHGFGSFLDSTYQLEINTTTTIITFLMVALLQNAATRDAAALNHKLNAIADGLADVMEHLSDVHQRPELCRDIHELRLAVGLEERESTT